MKKLINDPEAFVEESLAGLLLAYPDHLRAVEGHPRVLVRSGPARENKVGICTGGGSGHLPVFLGYVGPGLADGVAVGNVFSSPGSDDMLTAIREVDAGAGVLCLFGNYQGDRINFEMAGELAELDGIKVATSVVADDVASARRSGWQQRRGVAGVFLAYKVAGAAADAGADIATVKETVDDAIANMATLGVATAPCTIPAVGEPSFELGPEEMELGMGIHGEPGIERTKLKSADEIATTMTDRLIADLELEAGEEVTVLINGLGATPPEELFILYRRVAELLEQARLSIHRPYVGNYATSMEMAGASLTLMRLDTDRKRLLDAPAFSPFLPQWTGR